MITGRSYGAKNIFEIYFYKQYAPTEQNKASAADSASQSSAKGDSNGQYNKCKRDNDKSHPGAA